MPKINSLRLVPFMENPHLEKILWDIILSDISNYFFYGFDMIHYNDSIKIYFAVKILAATIKLDEIRKSDIHGIILIYKGNIVQIRGSKEAVDFLIQICGVKNPIITVPEDYKELVLKKYERLSLETTLARLRVDRGQEKLFNKHKSEVLTYDDRKEIADLMLRSDPIWWADATENTINKDNQQRWIGIRKDGILISAVGSWVDEIAGGIAIVATDPNYRRQGYALSLVSEQVEYILKKAPLSVIHVRADNNPAVKLYQKIGFLKVKEFHMFKDLKLKQ